MHKIVFEIVFLAQLIWKQGTLFCSKVVFDKQLCTLLYIGSSKIMKCKIEGGLGFPPFSDEQLWKLDGKMIINKKGLWKSGEKQKWKFTSKGDLIRIENIWKKKVFGTTNDILVKLENLEDNKDGQLWNKGEPNNDGYFTLENYKVSKFLTAVPSEWDIETGILELKGNITLRWISLTS